MFPEIHRHFVLCKRSGDGRAIVYRQIVLIERDQFELRVIDCDAVDLDPTLHEHGEFGEAQLYDDLALGILGAEREYRLSVTRGWRALDSTVPAFADLRARRAVA